MTVVDVGLGEIGCSSRLVSVSEQILDEYLVWEEQNDVVLSQFVAEVSDLEGVSEM